MKNKGFTLTELMATISIMSILMAVAVPTFLGARNHANDSACRANLNIIKSAVKEWALDYPDLAVKGHAITTTEIDPYIDGEYASLHDPHNGQYDVIGTVVTIDPDDGSIPDPVCSVKGIDFKP